jgi:hypothetical protein
MHFNQNRSYAKNIIGSSQMITNHKIKAIFSSIAFFFIASTAFACDPVHPDLNGLMQDNTIAVVKGHILPMPTKTDPYHTVFHVTETLRGTIKLGKYELAEGGPFGSRCEYAELAVSYPSASSEIANLKKETDQYLFVTKLRNNTLITPIFMGYGLAHNNGLVSARHADANNFINPVPINKFTAYFRSKTKIASPLWVKNKNSQQ